MSEEPLAITQPPDGVVLPPKDIRSIVEKTAGYVARNGIVFEDRIRENERTNPKFSFLSANDAYNPYYAWRLSEVRAGRGTAVSAGRVGEAAIAQEPEKPKGPPPPPEFQFSARMPTINAQDLDVVKLTALFVAKNGRSFMTALGQKESRNFQFDFLRPTHSLYQFFSRLIDQYTDLLQAPTVDGGKAQKARLEEAEANVKNKFHVMERARQRAEYVKYQEKQKQKKAEEEEQERIEYAQIDWHDFVVVETVLFTDADEQADLPPTTSLNDLQSASLEQKAAMSLQPHDRRIEEAMPTYEDTTQTYPQLPQKPPPVNHSMAPPPMPLAPPPNFAQNPEELRAIAERSEMRDRAQAAQAAAKLGPGQAPMRIRSDYVPRAQAKRQNVPMGLCPNCHQQIPIDEMTEHMKIELLDPRWREQRQRLSGSASNAVDVSHLKRKQDNQSNLVGSAEEEARRKRAAMAPEGVSVEEQIQKLQQRYGQ